MPKSFRPKNAQIIFCLLSVFSALLAVFGAVLLCTSEAYAQSAAPYSLFNPVPENKLRDFDPERPNFEAGPITVDAGHFQYEGDFFFYDLQQNSNQRTRTVYGP
ncbi:MAG: hypothetical protein ACKOW3_02090, partial [Hyphomicrobium sp.]